MINHRIKFVIAGIILLGAGIIVVGAPTAHAATLTATTCNRGDVQEKIDLAVDGDTVRIPAGTCTWTTQVTLTPAKAITVQGAGIDQTIIVDNVPKLGGAITTVPLFIELALGKKFRLTGMTIRGLARETEGYNNGILTLSGTAQDFRVDHIKFDDPGNTAIRYYGHLYGVVDHCIFNLPSVQGNVIFHESWNNQSWGDGSFADALYLGTEKAIYLEDNTFIGGGIAGQGAVDSFGGGRFVLRYNTVTNDNLGSHGTESPGRFRGVRSYEIYNNTFTTTPVLFSAIYLRGGTGVIFNNTFTGYASGVVPATYRADLNYPPWGKCDGTSLYDGRQLPNGYPCIDQVGRGTSDLLTGDDTPTPVAWPHQILDPLYLWNNTWTPVEGYDGALVSSQHPAWIAENRDFYRNTPKPGYTAYVYPHPLTLGGPPPPPPSFDFSLASQNMTVVQGQSVTNTITATLVSGTSRSVSFNPTVTGLPAGATASFSPTSCTPTCTSVLTIQTLSTTPTGTFPNITVTGTAGSLNHATQFTLTVQSPPIFFQISNVTAISTNATTTITWTTDVPTSSFVYFHGRRLFAVSPETDIGSMATTTHKVILSGLVPCSTYQYAVAGRDAGNRIATSSLLRFATKGCIGGADVIDEQETDVNNDGAPASSLITLATATTSVSMSIPHAAVLQQTVFQIQRLNRRMITPQVAPLPSANHRIAGDHVYQFTALSSTTTQLTNLLRAIRISVQYHPLDVQGIAISTLKLYRWNGSIWSPVSCTVIASTRVVNCITTNFSPFVLMGTVPDTTPTPYSTPAPSGGGGGVIPNPTLPSPITDFLLSTTTVPTTTTATTTLTLTWKNSVSSDYIHTLIIRKYGSKPDNPADGAIIYEGTATSSKDTASTTQTIFYAAYVYARTSAYSNDYLNPVIISLDPIKGFIPAPAPAPVPTPPSLITPILTRTLSRGIRRPEVRVLQTFLISQHYLASGNDTGYFGLLTEAAVRKFQCAQHLVCKGTPLTTGYGVVGPKTRALINAFRLTPAP